MSRLDNKALRSAFVGFMSGVTVVVARDDTDRPMGFIANLPASVAMDLPLLLTSIDESRINRFDLYVGNNVPADIHPLMGEQ